MVNPVTTWHMLHKLKFVLKLSPERNLSVRIRKFASSIVFDIKNYQILHIVMTPNKVTQGRSKVGQFRKIGAKIALWPVSPTTFCCLIWSHHFSLRVTTNMNNLSLRRVTRKWWLVLSLYCTSNAWVWTQLGQSQTKFQEKKEIR